MATAAPIQGEIEEPENSRCEVSHTTGIGGKTPEIEESPSKKQDEIELCDKDIDVNRGNILFESDDNCRKTYEVESAAKVNLTAGGIQNFESESFKKSSSEGEAATDVILTQKENENELMLPRDQFQLLPETNDPLKHDKAYASPEEKDAAMTKDKGHLLVSELLSSEEKNATVEERAETGDMVTANGAAPTERNLDNFANSCENDKDAEEVNPTKGLVDNSGKADINYKDPSILEPNKFGFNKDENFVFGNAQETQNIYVENQVNHQPIGQSFDCDTGSENKEMVETEQNIDKSCQKDATFSLGNEQDLHAHQNLKSEWSRENSDGPCEGSPDAKIYGERAFQGNSDPQKEIGTSAIESVTEKGIEQSLCQEEEMQLEEVNIPAEAAVGGNITSKGNDNVNTSSVGPQEQDSKRDELSLPEASTEMEEDAKVVETVVGNVAQISALDKALENFNTENVVDTSAEDKHSQNETLKVKNSLEEETENEQLAKASPLANENSIAIIDSTNPSEPAQEASAEEKEHDKDSSNAKVDELPNELTEMHNSSSGTLVVEEKIDDVTAREDNHSIERSDSKMEDNKTEIATSLLEAEEQIDQTNSEKNVGTSGLFKEKEEEKDFSCAAPLVSKEDVTCATYTKHETPGDGILSKSNDRTFDLREQIKEETEEKGEENSTSFIEDQNNKTTETSNNACGMKEEDKDRESEVKKEENNAVTKTLESRLQRNLVDGEQLGKDCGLDSKEKLENINARVSVEKEDSAQSLQNGASEGFSQEIGTKNKSCESNKIPEESKEDEINMLDVDAKPNLDDLAEIGLQEEKHKERIGEALQPQDEASDILQREQDCNTTASIHTVDAECSMDEECPSKCYHASEINITPAKEINKEFSEMHPQGNDFEKSEHIQEVSEPKEDNEMEKIEIQFESASKRPSHGPSFERQLPKIEISTDKSTPDEIINNVCTLHTSKDRDLFSSTESIESIKGTKDAVESIRIPVSVEKEESTNAGEICDENLQLIDADTQICDNEYPPESRKKLKGTGTFDKHTDVETSEGAAAEGLTEENIHMEDASSSVHNYAEMKEACKSLDTEESIVQDKVLKVDEGLIAANTHQSVEEQRTEDQNNQKNVDMNLIKDEQSEQIFQEDVEENHEVITPQRAPEDQGLMGHITNETTKLDTQEKEQDSGTASSVTEVEISFSNKEDEGSQAASASMTTVEDIITKEFVGQKDVKDANETIRSIERYELKTLVKDCLSVSKDQQTHDSEVSNEVGGIVKTRCEDISEQFSIEKEQKLNKPTEEKEVEQKNHKINREEAIYVTNDEGECTSPDNLKVKGGSQILEKEHLINPKDWVQQDDINIDDVIPHVGIEDENSKTDNTANTREKGENKEVKTFDAVSTEKTIETTTTTEVEHCITEEDHVKLDVAQVVGENEASYGSEIVSQYTTEERETMPVQNSKAPGNESVEEQRAEEQNNLTNVDMNLKKDKRAEQIFEDDVEDEAITPQRVTEDQRQFGDITDDPTKIDTEEKSQDQDSGTTSSLTEVSISVSNKEDEEGQAASAAMTMMEDNSTKEFVGEKDDKDEREPSISTERNEVELLTKDCLSASQEQQTHESEVSTEAVGIVITGCEDISEQFPIENEQELNKPTLELEVEQQTQKKNTEEAIYVANDEGACTSPKELKVKGDNQTLDKDHIVNPKDWVQQDDITIDDVAPHVGVEDKNSEAGNTTNNREEGESKKVKTLDAVSTEKTIETTTTTTEVERCITEEDRVELDAAQVVGENEASYGTEIVSQYSTEERETMLVQNSKAPGNESVEEQRAEEQNNQTNVDMNLGKNELVEQIFQENVAENDEAITPQRVTEDQRPTGEITDEPTKPATEEKDQDSRTASSVTEVDITFSNKEDKESQADSVAMTMMQDNSTKEFIGRKHDKDERESIISTEREIEMLTKDCLSVSQEQQTHESDVSTEAVGIVITRCEEISDHFPIGKEQKLNKPTVELEVEQKTHKINTEEAVYVANDEGECTSPEDLKVKGDNQTLDKEHMVSPKDWAQQEDITVDDVIPHVGVEDKRSEAGNTTSAIEEGESQKVKAFNAASTEKTIVPIEKEQKLDKPTLELEVEQHTYKVNTEINPPQKVIESLKTEVVIHVANDEKECTSPENLKVKGGDNQTLDEEHMVNPKDCVQQDDIITNDEIPQAGIDNESCKAGNTSNIREEGESKEIKASSSAPTEKITETTTLTTTTETTTSEVACCMTQEAPEKLNVAQVARENEASYGTKIVSKHITGERETKEVQNSEAPKNEVFDEKFKVDETRETLENDCHIDMKMEDVSGLDAQDKRYPTSEKILDELKVVGIVDNIEEHAMEKELHANDFDTKLSEADMADERIQTDKEGKPDDASTHLDPDKQQFEVAATDCMMKSINQPEIRDSVSESKAENFYTNLTLEAVKKTRLNGDQDDAYTISDESTITATLSMVQGAESETYKNEIVKEQIKENIELNSETELLKLDQELDEPFFGEKVFHKDEKEAKQLKEETVNLEVSNIEVPPTGKWKDGETLTETSAVPVEEPNCKDNEDVAIEKNKEIDLHVKNAEDLNYRDDTAIAASVQEEVTEETEAARNVKEASNLAPENESDETTTAEASIADGSFEAAKPMHEHICSISACDTTNLGDTTEGLLQNERLNKASAMLMDEPSYKDKEGDEIIKEDKELDLSVENEENLNYKVDTTVETIVSAEKTDKNKLGGKLEEASYLATETKSEESTFTDKTYSESPTAETNISYGSVEVGKPKDNDINSVSACETTNKGPMKGKARLTEASEVLTEEPYNKEKEDKILEEDKEPELSAENVGNRVDNEVMTTLSAEETEENTEAGKIEASNLSPETKYDETTSTDKKTYSESTTAGAFVYESLTEVGKPKVENNSSVSADETTDINDITELAKDDKFIDASTVFVEEPSCNEKKEDEIAVEREEEEEEGKMEQLNSEVSGDNNEKRGPILEMPGDQILLKEGETPEEISYSKFKETTKVEDKLDSQSIPQTEEEKCIQPEEDGNKEQAQSPPLMLDKQDHVQSSERQEAEEITEQTFVENQVNFPHEKEENIHQTTDLEEQYITQTLLVEKNLEGEIRGKNTGKGIENDAQLLSQDFECPSEGPEKSASRESPAPEKMAETGAQKDVTDSKVAADVDVEEEKTDEEKEHEVEREHKTEVSGSGTPIVVEASREAVLKPSPKKSHNLLSGVGSKVKHSISKVKKAIIGKSSHPKAPSTSK